MLRNLQHRTQRAVPAEYQANFWHLYLDIWWFGVLSGSALSFLAVYLVRLGASSAAIGLVNAGPAAVTLLVALPSGWWLRNAALQRAVYRAAVFHRLFYGLWILLPFLFPPETQISLFILIGLGMSVPGTALAVGFNALFADLVPPEWRGQVVGVRNGLLAISMTGTSLVSGLILRDPGFVYGYPLVFFIGFLGAVMSSYHLGRLKVNEEPQPDSFWGKRLGDQAHPGRLIHLGDTLRTMPGLRYLTRAPQEIRSALWILKSPFRHTLMALSVFHLALYLAIPLYPLAFVEQIKLSDPEVSLGNALFHGFLFVGSTQLGRLTREHGNHRLSAIGALLFAVYPAFIASASTPLMFFFTSILGGLFGAIGGGAVNNYVLEKVPAGHRPTYLAWYTLCLNGAVLVGSLGGPMLSSQLGLVSALLLIAVLRAASALLIWRLA
jgi:MFS family permease